MCYNFNDFLTDPKIMEIIFSDGLGNNKGMQTIE
jgi:hypothetical protein